MRRYFNLSTMRPRRVDSFIESGRSPFQGFQTHGARNISDARYSFCAPKSQTSHGAHRLGSIQQRDSFFDFELQGFDLRAGERLSAGQSLPIKEYFAFTDYRL